MNNPLSENAKLAMGFARREAQQLGHDYIGTEHILLGLIKLGNGTAIGALLLMGIDPSQVRSNVEAGVMPPKSAPIKTQQLPFTPGTKAVLEIAREESESIRQDYLGTGHLLLGLIREEDGIAGRVLRELGVELEPARKAVIEYLRRAHEDSQRGATS
jgi:ATP-dependent Clp protease ATP-binding subunit ClpC